MERWIKCPRCRYRFVKRGFKEEDKKRTKTSYKEATNETLSDKSNKTRV